MLFYRPDAIKESAPSVTSKPKTLKSKKSSTVVARTGSEDSELSDSCDDECEIQAKSKQDKETKVGWIITTADCIKLITSFG